MKIDISRLTIFLSVLVLFILALGLYLMYLQWGFDDSYIVYRVVKNILNGHGWVYNIGESRNVSTSVLNTVLLTALSYFIGDIRLAAHIIGGLAIFGAGLIVYWLFRQRFGNGIALLTGYLLIRQLGTNQTWGLESNLLICLILLFVLLESYRRNSWPLLGILVLTRPDGVLMVGLKWLKEFINRRRYSIKGVFTVLVILTPWLIFSLWQFHQIFPNTFSQKIWQGSSGYWGTGHIYLMGLIDHYFLYSSLLLKGAVGLGVVGLILMLRDRSPFLYIMVFGLLQQTAYVIFNVPVYHWYLALSDVLVCIAAFYTFGTLFSIVRERYAAPVTSWIAGFFHLSPHSLKVLSLSVPVVLLAPAVLNLKSGYENPRVDRRALFCAGVIEKIDTLYGPARLSVLEVGSIGFYTDRAILDIVGLTSTRGQFLTVQRMDAFYRDPPELLLLNNPIWPKEASIYNDYRFPIVYEAKMEFAKSGYPTMRSYRSMRLYVRKDDIDLSNLDAMIEEVYPAYQLDDRFGPDILKPLLQGAAYLDTINRDSAGQNPLVILERPLLRLKGWAVDIQRAYAPPNVFILLVHGDGQIYSLRAERFARYDVAEFLEDPVFTMSGFGVYGHTKSLPSGTYRIWVVQEVEGAYYYVELENRVQIP